MSTLQHINSTVNHFWPELSRRYPGFEKPQIVPAETLRNMAPVYLRSSIDRDPTSMYMFIAGDPRNGDCSRRNACRFFDELFYDKLQMPSSYDVQAGGQYDREEAINHEVLPPESDRQFQSYYNEQMSKVNAEEDRTRRAEKLGFDPDDPDIIDIGDDGTGTAVGQAQTTSVGAPKKIFFCVDFHCPSGGMLGYDGNGGRLGGRRGPGRYLREGEEAGEEQNETSEIELVSRLFAKLAEKQIAEDTGANFLGTVEGVASCGLIDKADAEDEPEKRRIFILRDGEGSFTWVECDEEVGSEAEVIYEKIDAEQSRDLMKEYKLGDCTVFSREQVAQFVQPAGDNAEDAEDAESIEECDVDEDDMLKNRPHNLHTDEKFELNESLIRLCGRVMGN